MPISSNNVPGFQEPPLKLLNSASLFLDFDETLVPIAARPDAIAIDSQLYGLLDKLIESLDGRIALVTGRSAQEAQRLLNAPNFVVVGSHGLEILWPDGRREGPPPPLDLDSIVEDLKQVKSTHPAVLVETKSYGAALHHRQAPDAEAACRALTIELASKYGMTIQSGKMVFELKAPGANKGRSVSALMANSHLAGFRPIYMGDDETDKSGFEVATRLGGAGILVGSERPTAATYRLDDVDAVLTWLAHFDGKKS